MIDWTKEVDESKKRIDRGKAKRAIEIKQRLEMAQAELEYIDGKRAALFEQRCRWHEIARELSNELYDLEQEAKS